MCKTAELLFTLIVIKLEGAMNKIHNSEVYPLMYANVTLLPNQNDPLMNFKLLYDTNNWMDKSLPYMKAFFDLYGSNLVSIPDQKTTTYIQIPSSTHAALCKATTELYSMFVKATEYVCRTPELWPSFGFPSQYWPRALASFFSGAKLITNCLDFSITPQHGMKCFEFSTDCTFSLLGCGSLLDLWSKAAGIEGVGVDAGIRCEERLVNAWHLLNLPKGTLVHFLHDNTEEERYHAMYMMHAAQKAGLVGKCFSSVESFSFDKTGNILDDKKKAVKYVWKTWSYTTLLSQWNGEPLRHSGKVRLIDICLSEDVIVFEPWWSAIPASKAILPVLSEMFPDHPNLLYSSWKVNERLRKTGYVAKPVSGRCGENIVMHSPATSSEPEEEEFTDERFKSDKYVYQELCKLPVIDREYVQVSTLCAAGQCAGTIARGDKSPVLGPRSSVKVLRVVDDGTVSSIPTDEVVNSYHYISINKSYKVIFLELINEINGVILERQPASFGMVIGCAPSGIPAYSSDYDTVDKTLYTADAHFRHQVGNLFYGLRYQCVEFARRWLIHAMGLTFGDVGMAFEIFDMLHAVRVIDGVEIPWTNIPNGSSEHPVPGALLIWNEGGEYAGTGHVAVVVEVSDEWVRVAEQNFDNNHWPRGQNWARQLAMEYDKVKGTYFIKEVNGSVKGWKHLPKDFVPNPVPLPKSQLCGSVVQ